MRLLKQSVAMLALTCGMLSSSFFSATAVAQQNVCVVDVAKIFESHSGFNTQLENLKQQAEEYKLYLQQRGEQLRGQSEGLQQYKPGTPEYNSLETEIAQKAAALEVERKNKTREFIQAEAQLHFDTYVQVTNAIASYCEQRGYRAAIRFSKTQVDPTNASSIMQRVNEYVVFHQPQIDITDNIIQMLGGTAAQTSGRPSDLPKR